MYSNKDPRQLTVILPCKHLARTKPGYLRFSWTLLFTIQKERSDNKFSASTWHLDFLQLATESKTFLTPALIYFWNLRQESILFRFLTRNSRLNFPGSPILPLGLKCWTDISSLVKTHYGLARPFFRVASKIRVYRLLNPSQGQAKHTWVLSSSGQGKLWRKKNPLKIPETALPKLNNVDKLARI